MKKPYNFDAKLAHSIQLLQKAEKFALRFNPEEGYYLAFSGGKDSQAIYHVAQMAGVKFKAHMNLTSVDPPEVIRFVRTQYPDVTMHKPIDSIFNLAIKKGLPTQKMRWCCAVMKEGGGSGMAVIIGIRHAESSRRANRNEVEMRSRKFSGKLEEWEQFREGVLIEKNRRNLAKGTGFDKYDPKTDTTTTCMSGKDSLLISPIIDWTEDDVWYFLNEVAKVPHCELYDQGWTRIGCIGCPMSNKKQWKREEERWPHVKRNWLKVCQIRMDAGKIPAGFESAEDYYTWWQSRISMKEYLFNKRQQTINFDEP